MAACSWRKASRTLGHSDKARGVGSMPWPWRWTNSSPKVSRKRRSALLTAGCVNARLRAALVRLRSAITSSKTRSRFRSRVRKLGVIEGWTGLIITIVNELHYKYKVD